MMLTPILDTLRQHSPYLKGLIEQQPDFITRIEEEGIDAVAAAIEATWQTLEPVTPEQAAQALRRRKKQVALLTALADVSGHWPLERITMTLSSFADYAVASALASVCGQAVERGWLDRPDDPQRSGIFVLAMGKMGAEELNYSSDIDLIFFYDADSVRSARPDKLRERLIRLVRQTVAIIDDRTADGYVFRTDLRLRPDPASTPPIMTVTAAESYYTSLAQTWERAAFIKARVCAGDHSAGNAFLQEIRPFIWRRYLDFAAIADIGAMKRTMHNSKGHGTLRLAGHDIKIGAGGIREIEFFAQTQQLIWGGRDEKLRTPQTVTALRRLAQAGHISPEVAQELSESYTFLRTLEHRLQMTHDEQTQTLPDDCTALASFMGFTRLDMFEQTLGGHLRRVHDHYRQLFADTLPAAQPDGRPGTSLASGPDAQPALARQLETMGFADADKAAQLLARWQAGQYPVLRTPRARQLLQEIMPHLLEALTASGAPDSALMMADRFMERLAGGVQLFSLLKENRHLMVLLADILGSAPSLAVQLAQEPALTDYLLTGSVRQAPDAGELKAMVDAAVSYADGDYETALRALRTAVREGQFLTGLAILGCSVDADAVSAPLTALADSTIRHLVPMVTAEFARTHGSIAGGELAVLGLGKHGSVEMSVASDLDLVFVYDAPESAQSDGRRPLPTSVYYARLCQRLLTAMTVAVGESALFEVDMRLRPSGNAGPIAVHKNAFLDYQRGSAWTWEHMALTRSRIVYASPHLAAQLQDGITSVLRQVREKTALQQSVAEMHQRLQEGHPPRDHWHIKRARGGLLDIEFLTQYHQLLQGSQHPGILLPHTEQALQALADAGLFVEGERLAAVHHTYRRLQHLLRLTLGKASPLEQALPALQHKIARLCEQEDFTAADGWLKEQQAWVWTLLQQTLYS